jgi:hypothetical protein
VLLPLVLFAPRALPLALCFLAFRFTVLVFFAFRFASSRSMDGFIHLCSPPLICVCNVFRGGALMIDSSAKTKMMLGVITHGLPLQSDIFDFKTNTRRYLRWCYYER